MPENLLRDVKGRLAPPSSRSFHEMYRYIIGTSEKISRQLDAIEEKLDYHTDKMHAIEGNVDAIGSHLTLYAWEILRKESEDLEATKKRFFKNMPQATGGLRLFQLASAQLLREFDALCNEHGLEYWLYSGTLIGAMRHEGFIPWDDDIDLGMIRADALKLIDIVSDNPRFQATIRYDWYPVCRQVRFRYRNSDAPCFLDLFLFDYTSIPARDAFDRMQSDRVALFKAAKEKLASQLWGCDNQFIDVENPGGATVAARFDEAVAAGYSEGGYLTEDPSQAQGIIWGVDNVDAFTGRKMYFNLNSIKPLKRMRFEGSELLCPQDSEKVLSVIYGDPYELPSDIKSHFAHVDPSDLESGGPAYAILKELVDLHEKQA